jgi:hypothetical protein
VIDMPNRASLSLRFSGGGEPGLGIKKAAATTAVMAAAASVFTASPASAHDWPAWVVSDDGKTQGYATTSRNHTHFEVCDKRADGIGVYGRMKLRNGTIIDVVDPNGSKDGCGPADTSPDNPIVEIEAVWRGGATSGWRAA